MNIARAIIILANNGVRPEGTTWGDYLKAVKLGEEALEWREEVIRAGFKPSPPLLPSETKD